VFTRGIFKSLGTNGQQSPAGSNSVGSKAGIFLHPHPLYRGQPQLCSAGGCAQLWVLLRLAAKGGAGNPPGARAAEHEHPGAAGGNKAATRRHSHSRRFDELNLIFFLLLMLLITIGTRQEPYAYLNWARSQ